MGKRPKRKIVLVLVEGKSDREALRSAISELYERIDENIEVFFPVIRDGCKDRGGDITTSFYIDKRNKSRKVTPENIEDAIYLLFLENFFDQNKIMPKDISEIIQVVDLDGAYIPDDCVLLDSEIPQDQSPFYDEENIYCSDVAKIIKRNKQKRENLDYLSSRKTIKVKSQSKPYSIYYFSSNLDHFLHHDANLDNHQKVKYAEEFSFKFIENVEGFVNEISEDQDATRDMTYKESWNYIKEGTHSLERHTNLNLLMRSLWSEFMS